MDLADAAGDRCDDQPREHEHDERVPLPPIGDDDRSDRLEEEVRDRERVQEDRGDCRSGSREKPDREDGREEDGQVMPQPPVERDRGGEANHERTDR
jgi:hypothetical protein